MELQELVERIDQWKQRQRGDAVPPMPPVSVAEAGDPVAVPEGTVDADAVEPEAAVLADDISASDDAPVDVAPPPPPEMPVSDDAPVDVAPPPPPEMPASDDAPVDVAPPPPPEMPVSDDAPVDVAPPPPPEMPASDGTQDIDLETDIDVSTDIQSDGPPIPPPLNTDGEVASEDTTDDVDNVDVIDETIP